MKIDIATPAMLFPAISLLLLAYTNRFLTLATIIRNFSKEERDENTQAQIKRVGNFCIVFELFCKCNVNFIFDDFCTFVVTCPCFATFGNIFCSFPYFVFVHTFFGALAPGPNHPHGGFRVRSRSSQHTWV